MAKSWRQQLRSTRSAIRKQQTAWDKALDLEVWRSPHTGECEKGEDECQRIDPGVNFFVLALEKLGATPLFSCDGHGDPCQFYVSFRATEKLARRIQSAGYFRVEAEGNSNEMGEDQWSLRLGPGDSGCCGVDSRDVAQTLRWASEAWIEEFD